MQPFAKLCSCPVAWWRVAEFAYCKPCCLSLTEQLLCEAEPLGCFTGQEAAVLECALEGLSWDGLVAGDRSQLPLLIVTPATGPSDRPKRLLQLQNG